MESLESDRIDNQIDIAKQIMEFDIDENETPPLDEVINTFIEEFERLKERDEKDFLIGYNEPNAKEISQLIYEADAITLDVMGHQEELREQFEELMG